MNISDVIGLVSNDIVYGYIMFLYEWFFVYVGWSFYNLGLSLIINYMWVIGMWEKLFRLNFVYSVKCLFDFVLVLFIFLFLGFFYGGI